MSKYENFADISEIERYCITQTQQLLKNLSWSQTVSGLWSEFGTLFTQYAQYV